MTLKDLFDLARARQVAYSRPASIISFDHSVSQILRHLPPDLPVADLTPAVIQSYVVARRAESSAATTNKDLRHIRASLNYAAESGYITSVPKIRLLKTPLKKNLNPLSQQEIEHLVSISRGIYKAMLTLLSLSACRLNEVLSLRWNDVHPDHLIIRPEHAKSHQHREIPISERTFLLLKQHRERCQYRTDADLVFANRFGRQKDRVAVSDQLRKIFKKAGVYTRGSVAHLLRHTAASRMLTNGGDLESVKTLLGHANLTTTALYLHSTPESRRKAAALLEL